MVFEHIRKLQQEYTDKFVVVDEQRSELSRFKGLTGSVKTVNMSGRALVEFGGSKNVGWFDIDIDYLKVIDEPLEEVESAKPAASGSVTTKAPQAGKSKSGDKGEKSAVSDILAAARAGVSAEPATSKTPEDTGKQDMGVADILAAARGKAAPAKSKEKPAAAAKKDATKDMGVADILAAARGNSAPAKPAAVTKPKDPKTTDAKELSVADVLAAARKPQSESESPNALEAMEAGRSEKDSADDSKPNVKDPKDMSVSDILAAARGNASAATDTAEAPETTAKKPAAKVDAKDMSVSDILAAARGNASAATDTAEAPETTAKKPAAKVDAKDMSVSDILAAARGNASAVQESPAAKADEPGEPAASKPPKSSESDSSESLPAEVADIVAYCRRVDG